jgi:hypothetical protein
VEIVSVCYKEVPSDKFEKLMNFSKDNNQCQRLQNLAHFFPVRIELLLKGILPANQNIQGDVRLFLSK